MCIPLMAILIAAIFFFGWVMRNQQRVRIATRYTSWKSVYDAKPSTQELNEKFFDGRGYNVDRSVDPDTITKSVREKFIDKVPASDNKADLYAEDIVSRNLPRGSYAMLRSQFSTNSGRWREWAESGALERTHVRDGKSWIRGETQMPSSIRDIYLEELNDLVDDGSAGGEMIRTLYINGW